MEQVHQRLASAIRFQDPLERQMAIASVICSELANYGTRTVVVGGSAVEFYTMANYLTMDIDLIATTPEYIKQVMLSLGFKSSGGTWYLPEHPKVIVEFPPGPLAGSWERVQPVTMPDGTVVNVIGLEDIIIDRALAATYWTDSPEWVRFLMVAHYHDIDWGYLLLRAKEELCSETIEKCRVWALEQLKELESTE